MAASETTPNVIDACPVAPDVLLAMDTSGDVCSVAVLRDGKLIAEHTFRHGMHLSERLMAHVDGVLSESDSALSDVTAFAVGLGPGSFTGTRIGVMTVKTLASVLDRPVYGGGSLDVIAQAYSGLVGALVVPMAPCRVGSVYAGVYSAEGDAPSVLIEPAAFTILELGAVLAAQRSAHVVFCGPAGARYELELREVVGEPFPRLSFGQAVFPRAEDLAQIVVVRRRSGAPPDDPFSLVPLYISPPPITMPKVTVQPTSSERITGDS